MALAEVTDPWVPADTFGARLAQIRQAMGGWNVKKMASHCNLDDQSWRNWERGEHRPRDYETICKQIAEATGCSLDWLMRGGPVICWTTDAPTLTCLDGPAGDLQLSLAFPPVLSLAST